MEKYLFCYVIIINVINFLLFTIDKRRAQKGRYRIPEFWLFFISLIGGAMGGIISMYSIKHKINKISFSIGIPILLIINFISLFYLSKIL